MFLMKADPTRPGRPRARDFRRAGRAGVLPTTRELVATLPRFLRRSYHPIDEGSTSVALAYLRRSPAALAATTPPAR